MPNWMYDRENVVDDIRKLLSERRHIRVCGPRKVGKTTILDNLGDRLGAQFHYFNCEITGASSPESIANGMKRAFHVDTPREAPGDKWTYVMYEVLEYLKGKNDDSVVIIDELSDALSLMTIEQRHDFLDNLLTLPGRTGVKFIICGSTGLDKILDEYEQAHRIKDTFVPVVVRPFDVNIAKGFIKECCLMNGYTIPDDFLSVLAESLISCFGENSLFPLFLDRFITHTIPKTMDNWVDTELDEKKRSEITIDIKNAYDDCIQQVVDVCLKRSTGGGPLQDLVGYVHLIEGDLRRTGGLSKARAQLVTRTLLLGEITPVIVSSLRDEGIEIILRNLLDNYLIERSGDNYISYIKFLADVWSRLHPLEADLEERRDD